MQTPKPSTAAYWNTRSTVFFLNNHTACMQTEMSRRALLTCILLTAVFIVPALPPLAGATTLPETTQTHAAVLDYYNAARTILYASLAISGANVAFAYHFHKKRNPPGEDP